MKLRVAVFAAAVAAAGVSMGLTTASAQAGKTVWDGVFTEEQATRGEPLYTKECASCHGSALEGGEMAPPLVGSDFRANWDTLPLGELAERMRTTMPQENPGSLSRQQNSDVLAYMLKKDGMPVGQAELPGGADALNAIKYHAQKPEGK